MSPRRRELNRLERAVKGDMLKAARSGVAFDPRFSATSAFGPNGSRQYLPYTTGGVGPCGCAISAVCVQRKLTPSEGSTLDGGVADAARALKADLGTVRAISYGVMNDDEDLRQSRTMLWQMVRRIRAYGFRLNKRFRLAE